MMIDRRWQLEQTLQQLVNGCGREKVLSAHDMCDPLQRIVENNSEMITRAYILAAQHNVSPRSRLRMIAGRSAQGTFEIKTQAVWLSLRELLLAQVKGQFPARSGINRRTIRIAQSSAVLTRGHRNLCSRAETWVYQPLLRQSLQSRTVARQLFGLTKHGRLPL